MSRMTYPLPEIETLADLDRIFEWCELRKFNVWFRSTHHPAATPKSVFMMRKAIERMGEWQIGSMMKNYEIVFEGDDCAIEYRLRFL